MKSCNLLLLLAALFCFSSVSIARRMVDGRPLSIIDNATEIRTYIVHVLRPEGADELLTTDERLEWHLSFLPNLTLDSGEPRLVYSYAVVISGFAARLAGEEVRAMEATDGFLLAYPDDGKIVPLTTHTPAFLGLSQNGGPWQDGSFGEGMIIGVVDSGIVPTHPSFSGDNVPPPPMRWKGTCQLPFVCNNKLVGARGYSNGRPISPLDKTGHGTHTASTAAGNYVPGAGFLGQAMGTAVGMAPRAHLAIYKTCCDLWQEESDSLAGIEQAIVDGVDVLSLSLGYEAGQRPNTYDRDLYAKASFAAMEAGILTCAAGGNVGPSPSTIDNDAPWMLTVGASTTDRRVLSVVRLGNGQELEGAAAYPSINVPMVPIANSQIPGANPCFSGTLDPFDVKGKIVVLCGSGLTDADVKAAGAAGLIAVNLPSEGFTLKELPFTLPASYVSSDDGRKLIAYLTTTKNPTAAIVFKGSQLGARPSPAVASLSSRGPSLVNNGILKPDIVAPGVNILAAWHKEILPDPTAAAPFFLASGTSMAAPHISGVVALIKKKHSNWSPAAIKSALMTTTDPLDSEGNPMVDQHSDSHNPKKANAFATGAGHVNPPKAMDPGLVYDNAPDDYIRYLCGLPRYTSKQVTIIAKKRVSCPNLKTISAEDLNYPTISVSLGSATTKKTVTRTVTNVGSGASEYTAEVTKPSGVEVVVTPKSLKFSVAGEKKSFTVEISTGAGANPKKGDVLEGQLVWSDNKHKVRSPIVVTH